MGKMDQEIIRFSVIMPLYNKAAYVEKAIRSVLEQTYPHYELIVINDGSTDNSAILAEELLKDVPNARLINQENAGVAVARNNGVAQAKGDYLCFLDADDWWDISFLQEMQQFIKDYPEAGIWGTNYWYVKNGHKRIVNGEIKTGYINFCAEYAKSVIQVLWTGSVCLRKDTYNRFNGFQPNLRLGEDFILWLNIALNYKVAFLNKQLSFYNFDVDIQTRAISKLHKPLHHMLWNLDSFYEYEIQSDDVKILFDRLRVHGLLKYWLNDEYHELAKQELVKVDWSKQPAKVCKMYNTPIWVLRAKQGFMRVGSLVKQSLIRLIFK